LAPDPEVEDGSLVTARGGTLETSLTVLSACAQRGECERFRSAEGDCSWALEPEGLDGRTGRPAPLVMPPDEALPGGGPSSAERGRALLAEARAILASGLDFMSMVEQLGRLALRGLADGCWIDLVMSDGALHEVSVAIRDPEQAALYRELQRYPRDSQRYAELFPQVGNGEVVRFGPLDHALLAQLASCEEHLALLHQVTLDAVLVVPLMSAERLVGVVKFGRHGRGFTPDDEERCVALARCTLAPVDSARAYRAERAARLEAERTAAALHRLQELTSALSGALTTAEVADVIARRGAAALDAPAGIVSCVSEDGEQIEPLAHHGLSPEAAAHLGAIRVYQPSPMCAALGRRTPMMVDLTDDAAASPGIVAAVAIGMRTMLCVPLLLNARAIGVLTVMFPEGHEITARGDEFTLTLARQCAQALDRARLFELERRLSARFSFLSRASERLSSSLDYETTLENVVSLAVPALADHCTLEVTEGDAPRRIERRADLSLMPPASEGAAARDATSAPPGLDVGSKLSVPLTARGAPLGELTLCFSDSGRRHTAIDHDLAEELALRAATAIENARLHRASQEATRLAEEANHAKDEFLGVVSHELRTPLNAILGWSQILRRDKAIDPAVLAKGLAIVDRNARMQVKLIEDILDVSRIISGKLRLELRPLDLAALIRAAVEVVRPAADAKGVELFALVEPGAMVSGDPERLQQIVWNLVSNAVKFTPKDGFVEVRLERRERTAVILVRDSGNGISPDFIPYVFERFRQADSSTTRRHGGLGLGLAIVRHLVELHGGRVEVQSAGLDRGATFTVELPLRPESLREREASAHGGLDADFEGSAVRLDGLKVVVVDDEADARDTVMTLLEVHGAVVSAASSAAEAIARLEECRADVLVSDIGMPGEDGYALMSRIRASGAPYARIPAIALTAYAAPDDARRVALAGFHAHLPKPTEPAVLAALVANLSGKPAWTSPRG
jgi:signal transduction histidine kinase/ActR/RegA family two-component response regulator